MKPLTLKGLTLSCVLLFTPSLYAFEIMSDAEIFSAIDAEGDHAIQEAVQSRINYALEPDFAAAQLDDILSGIDSEYVPTKSMKARVSYSITPNDEDDRVSALFDAIGGGNDY